MSPSSTESLSNIVVAAVAIFPATLAAIYGRKAFRTSDKALHEVRENGGMQGNDPTLKDRTVYLNETVDIMDVRLQNVNALLLEHLKHSDRMDELLLSLVDEKKAKKNK